MRAYLATGGWYLEVDAGPGDKDEGVLAVGPLVGRPRPAHLLAYPPRGAGRPGVDNASEHVAWAVAGKRVCGSLTDRLWIGGRLAHAREILLPGPGGAAGLPPGADLGMGWPLPVPPPGDPEGPAGADYRMHWARGWRRVRRGEGPLHTGGLGMAAAGALPPPPGGHALHLLRTRPHLGTIGAAVAAGLVPPGEEETADAALRAAWAELLAD